MSKLLRRTPSGALITEHSMDYIAERFVKYYGKTEEELKSAYEEYSKIKPFDPDGNVFESGQEISDNAHLFGRLLTQYYLDMSMRAQCIDMVNPNVSEDLSVGNIGTAGRVAKVQMGYDTHDYYEMASGRWAKPIRLAKFPNPQTVSFDGYGDVVPGEPIIKKVSLVSNCSHHLLPFSSAFQESSEVIIAYIPDEFVLGISKLSKIVNFIARRYYLQEDLTKKIYEAISEAAATDNVYVGLYDVVHTCESLRSTREENGGFTTRHYGGVFKTNPEMIKMVEKVKKG